MASKMKLFGLQEEPAWTGDHWFFATQGVEAMASFRIYKDGRRWRYWARLYAGGYQTMYTSGPGYDDEGLALKGLRRWLKLLVKLANGDMPEVEITKSGKQFGWKVKWAEGFNREQEVETVYTKRSSAERAADKYVEALRELARAIKGE